MTVFLKRDSVNSLEERVIKAKLYALIKLGFLPGKNTHKLVKITYSGFWQRNIVFYYKGQCEDKIKEISYKKEKCNG